MSFRLSRRAFHCPLLAMSLLAAGPLTAPAHSAEPFRAAVQSFGNSEISGYYRRAGYRPLWVRNGAIVPAAGRLVQILRQAPLDGMESGPALAARLERAIQNARSEDPRALWEAELLLSAAWVDYVQTLRRPVKVGMIFTDGSLQPATPLVPEILGGLAAAPSMTEHLNAASKLNPIYNRLRTGLAAWKAQATPSLAAGFGLSEAEMEKRLKVNLDRARVLPGDQRGRYVLVDAASARLWLFEDGEVRDTMRVVVGKPGEQTPMLAGRIRSVVLNPYWNVPPDLVRSRVAAGVLKEGVSFLKNKNYQLLSDWSDTASLLDPAKVDWRAVAAGKKELRVRQLPGPDNAMGGMKFMFPNEYGIYLHDTPEKVLFSRDDRKLSSGCVRLEDSARLARWLLGSAPRPASDAPEQLVALPQPVPIYITYLTAEWTGERFTFRNDAYRRDMSGERLAQASNGAAPDRADKAADQYADRSGTPLHHSR